MGKKRGRARRALPVRIVPRAGGGLALEVAGVVQSIVSAEAEEDGNDAHEPRPGPYGGYWGLMLPPGCPRRVLVLGLGGGTVARLLARRCARVAITGVEHDEAVLATARAECGLDEIPQLRVELADAFRWVEEHAVTEGGSYDLICVDLFEGGRLTAGTLATLFLRALATLLAPEGILTVNLMLTARTPEQLHRLRRVFSVERELRLRGNLVVHARPLSAPLDQMER